jgi:tRNA-Thr(GGU) m(6)t(6)A37 methyltransferase TsaA
MEEERTYTLEDKLTPIGKVISCVHTPKDMPVTGTPAAIKIYPKYMPAMQRMEEHGYFWILCWFHEADRSVLFKVPGVNLKLPVYGVFGLRPPARPNPIALSLVKLEKIDGDTIYVSGLDAVDGTPVLDIKPYFEADIVFSPKTPYIPPGAYAMRFADFRKQALVHHGEECLGLELGVKMALLVEDYFGKIQSLDLKLTVEGDACLADVLQGLTRARLANPARFVYRESSGTPAVIWQKNDQVIKMTLREGMDRTAILKLPEEDLFILETL